MSGPVVRVPVGLKNRFKPGLTGVERVNVERLADEPLRVEHLIASLNEKLRARSRRVDVVELNGFAVQRHHALDSLLPGLETGSPRFVVTTVAGPFTQLFVKTLTGREISIVLPSNCWVDDIKSEIEKLEGIPTKHQRLIFAGFLLEDGRSLSFYRVKTGSTIDVGLNVRGGGPLPAAFADVSDNSRLETTDLSDKARRGESARKDSTLRADARTQSARRSKRWSSALKGSRCST